MKKIVLFALLAISTCILTSCTKGEGFFDGKWQSVQRDWHYNSGTNTETQDIETYVLEINKKNNEAVMTYTCPQNPNGTKRIGTYKMCDDYTIAITFKDEDGDEYVEIFTKKDKNTLMGYEYGYFYKVK